MSNAAPKFIELSHAVRQIHGAVRRAKASPYFVIIGAGVSCPEVPLARGIVDECKKLALAAGGAAAPPGTSLLHEYSHYLAAAYPDLADRRQYFAGLICGGRISRANFRLAHLLLGEAHLAFDPPRAAFQPIAKMVVTTNFDDHLERALKLFGVEPLVCDHPATTTRVEVARDDEVQIVHVHGSYRHYDIINLQDEMADTATLSRETTAGMANMLDALLKMRTPIVLGYGGWEGDVIMGALARRLRSQRSHRNIYWFCHSREEAYALPDWLKHHNDVYFVARAEQAPAPAPEAEPRPQSERTRVLDAFIRTVDAEQRHSRKLEAAHVLEELIRTFEYPVPTIIKSPLATLKTRLEREFPVANPGDGEIDLYGLRGVLDRLEQAQRAYEMQRPGEEPAAAAALAELRDAVAKAKYYDAFRIAKKVVPGFKAGGQEPFFSELVALCANIAEGIEDAPDKALQMWQFAQSHLPSAVATDAASPEATRIAVGEARALAQLEQYGNALALLDRTAAALAGPEPRARGSRLQVLMQRVEILEQAKRHGDILVATKALLHEFADDEADATRTTVAKTLISKARAERELREPANALESLRDVATRFGSTHFVPLQHQVAIALGMRSALHGQLRQYEEALRAAQESIDLFGSSPDPVLERQVVYALSLKARALADLDRIDEALAIYEDMIRRIPDARNPSMKAALIAALVDKGTMLLRIGRIDEAKECFTRVIADHADSGELLLQREYCRALRRLGRAQGKAGETEAAMKTYDALIATFGTNRDPRITRYVAYARNAIADLCLREAKVAWHQSGREAANPLLQRARAELLTARTSMEDPTIIGNLAYERCLSGATEEALKLMREALEMGGKTTFEGLKADVELNPVPPDAAFLAELMKEADAQGLITPAA